MPHEPSGDAADRRSAEDAAWREIVDHYGDRPQLEDQPEDDLQQEPVYEHSAPPPATEELAPEPPREHVEEHYVPPPPPPVPLAEPARLVAWLGLFAVPPVVLVALVARVSIPSWLGLLLMVWFVGGFVFLVASMRPGPRDDGDDGAVV